MKIPAITPRIASIVALLIAALSLLIAVLGPISVLPFALIPLIAGIGILRRRVWSAYGFALYQFSQAALAALLLLLPGVGTRPVPTSRSRSRSVSCWVDSSSLPASRSLPVALLAAGRCPGS